MLCSLSAHPVLLLSEQNQWLLCRTMHVFPYINKPWMTWRRGCILEMAFPIRWNSNVFIINICTVKVSPAFLPPLFWSSTLPDGTPSGAALPRRRLLWAAAPTAPRPWLSAILWSPAGRAAASRCCPRRPPDAPWRQQTHIHTNIHTHTHSTDKCLVNNNSIPHFTGEMLCGLLARCLPLRWMSTQH